jgi:hypothetical protein
MKSGGYLFFLGGLFYIITGAIYYVVTKEPVGTTALIFFLLFTQKRLGYQPEDNAQAEQNEAPADYGFYSPHSWWPMIAAGATAIVFLGLIFAVWILLLGLGLVLFAVWGWLFEYWKFERVEPIRH